MAMYTADDRDAIVDRLVALFDDDLRIEAVFLVGSLAAGSDDRWSDIDLEVAVRGSAHELADEWAQQMYAELPVVHHYETTFGTSVLRGFLLGNLLEVDLSFISATDLSIWPPVRLLFDRSGVGAKTLAEPAEWTSEAPDYAGASGFAWHDVFHACIAVRRGRLWQALWYLERVRNRTLRLASERHGWYAEFFDYVDDLDPVERDLLLGSLVGELTADRLLAAVEASTEGYLAELRRGAPELADQLTPALQEFVRIARAGGA
jgi:predicted nucleotidyltransferase